MKIVTLCRHAKSSWKHPELSDFDRPLNKRGERNAPVMAARLKEHSVLPDVVISSPAARARATVLAMAEATGFPQKDIIYEPRVYAASPGTLFAIIRALEDSYASLLLVGHNPEFTVLANALGGLHLANIPTCGIVSLRFPVHKWEEIHSGTGSLQFFDYPKNPQYLT
ncbi:SixA phosphatase family protein [Desulfogranum japonicum]|uniref:SixA phosphatase family protein n=1 Tax=Desulfogranum japonicum TaxID=231447 RepID=UPI00042510FE|nr:histidine phosphatase family protein [Desulfogranum japonicum]